MVSSLFYEGTDNSFSEGIDDGGTVQQNPGMGMGLAGAGSIRRPIPRPLWAAFLFEFTRDFRGRPVSIYTLQANQSPSERASQVPLESILLDDVHSDKNFVHVRIAPHKFNRGIDFMFFAQVVSVVMDEAGKAQRVIFDGSNGARTLVML
jgi:hypothetical protein